MQVQAQDILGRHFPDAAVEPVRQILEKNRIRLIFTRDRTTKLGDFRPGNSMQPHRISVNGILNPYAALLVFLHELAHFVVYQQNGKVRPPHGKVWKEEFGRLIRKSISAGFFPGDLSKTLHAYSFNVKASGMADASLTKKLRAYDSGTTPEGWLHLDELPERIPFQTRNGRLFVKGEKLRTRYRCQCLHTKRQYLVHSLSLAKEVG